MNQQEFLELGSVIYPHPVAAACGHVIRAGTPNERLDAFLRAGETITRYLAAVALASWAARSDSDVRLPTLEAQFKGNLSWGHFITAADVIAANTQGIHPLADLLRLCWSGTSKRAGAATSLKELLSLRNHLGHELATLTRAKAETLLAKEQPEVPLSAAMAALRELLDLPLFLVEDQQYRKHAFVGRMLLLMGESGNPKPEQVTLQNGIEEPNFIYLGTPSGVLQLHPWLTWALADKRLTYSVFMIDAIGDREVAYRSLFSDQAESNGDSVLQVQGLLRGDLTPLELVGMADGTSFVQQWRDRRTRIQNGLAVQQGAIPWNQLDPKTLEWYAQRLAVTHKKEVTPQRRIQEALLDGRTSLEPDEIRQLILLFGSDQAVRRTLGRTLLDCRARPDASARWAERVESTSNILESLRAAVDFFGRHLGIDGITVDGLRATSGTADYVAVREALVNLFIHQDYEDKRTVSQIEIGKDSALFMNAGSALVSLEALVDGGRSQARNPLAARALRLVGFAELAGSGLRALQQAWRDGQRQPPRLISDDVNNTFTLSLDWRPQPKPIDAFWRQRIGVKVSPEQARILSLLSDFSGYSPERIASGVGLSYAETLEALKYLQVQGLIVEDKGESTLSEHLRPLLESST